MAFAIKEGRTDNRFFRQGSVAAHVLVTSGESPRFVAAFPAGNTGIGLWFEDAADLAVEGELSAVEQTSGMRGVSVTIRAHVPRLRVRQALLGSVRVLRNFGHDGRVPKGLDNTIESGPPLSIRRTTIDGKHHVAVALEPSGGSSATADEGGRVTLAAGPSGDIVVRLTALCDETPLTPIPPAAIVTPGGVRDPRALEVLAFLTYEEKLLAGSWQYLTYFGRDTLLSTRLLMPVLKPAVVEAALGSVLERLSEDGEVAHEEDIGEFAAMRHREEKTSPADLRKPIYDYKMVDDDFILSSVLAAYVLDTDAGRARAKDFFARRTRDGRTYAEAAKKNLERVLAQAAPFAAKPSAETLIHIHEGMRVGNWRDSEQGLGNGRVPYDVNAALVPAALRATERLYATEPFGAAKDASARAADLGRSWTKPEAPFVVAVTEEVARMRISGVM